MSSRTSTTAPHDTPPLYLAVDGGGTRASFRLADARGATLGTFETGATSAKSVGERAAFESIRHGVLQLRSLVREHGATLDQVRGVWGLSGCDSAADQDLYEGMLARCGLDLQHHHVCNDALLALRCVTSGAGVVVVAGTGSVALGVDAHGATHRIGGWGYLASDLGSGCWMGSRLLREAALFADGCRAHDTAFEQVRSRLDCTFPQMGEAIARLCRADEIAAFARVVLACDDSPVCKDIRRRAAGYLAGYGAALACTLRATGGRSGGSADERTGAADGHPGGTDGCAVGSADERAHLPIALAGGVFRNEEFRRDVRERLVAQANVDPGDVHWVSASPTEGGLRMARALFG